MKRFFPAVIALLCAGLSTITANGREPVKVACIGNSITYGYTLEHRDSLCYPSQLQRMLGDDYKVGNFGRSGATLLRHGHRPYNEMAEWQKALAFDADIAVIHLGINDTDPRDWPLYGDDFVKDYVALIDTLRGRNPDIRIIISRLSPILSQHYRWRSGTQKWRLEIQKAIERVALATGAELIDFDVTLRDHEYLLEDGLHPNARGAQLMARTVAGALTGRYGPLRLPPVWQSGMVVQRDRPLRIKGTANAGTEVKIKVNGAHSVVAKTDNQGRWSAILQPFAVGDPYTIEVTGGADTVLLKDVVAGDVWVASGQSNMAFKLKNSAGGTEAIASSADSLLRFYALMPRAYTDGCRWSDDVIAAVDTLGYFLPGNWQRSAPESVSDFSAVAYYFAREMRKRTGVPVGIIENSVGGSPLESWIDVATLEESMPEILVNWRTNDYLQPWVQQRVGENVPAQGHHRHPYEPSYLYSAAIRPLEDFNVAGVIWYQGESNAHNTMVFENLFPLFVKSWRQAFGDDDMAVHTVQLSSIDRSSWPVFRDAQRRLAAEMEGVTLTVCSDLGDSLDVHPIYKRQVGERLALQAVRTAADAPLFGAAPAVHRSGRSVVLTFADGVQLTTSDGKQPSTFELAAIDGLFERAHAVIDGNRIILTCDEVAYPLVVRYGWQPFTRANVIEATDSLPLSTFKIMIEDDMQIEKGLEYGVSAVFAARSGDTLIMAGGCNFPTSTPLAPDARKRYYQGIYEADTASLDWRRVASMPEPMAYGATVAVPGGLIMIGGCNDAGSSKSVLSFVDGELKSLLELPVTFDNGAATAVGDRLYIAGGNQNGEPSCDMWMLDMSRLDKGWKKMKRMPGHARLQPVMTQSGGKVYLWGGFAPRNGKHEPTVDCDGLMYDVASDKWSRIPAPEVNGEELFLGGGCAATLPDGRIVAAGGVNKDVFLDALRNQAPDYLMHPVEWYKFNGRVMVYDVSTSAWEVVAELPEAARAGASICADGDNTVYLIGGEIKPRVRTPRVVSVIVY